MNTSMKPLILLAMLLTLAACVPAAEPPTTAPLSTTTPVTAITRERAIELATEACRLPHLVLVGAPGNIQAQLVTRPGQPAGGLMWRVQMDGLLQLVGGPSATAGPGPAAAPPTPYAGTCAVLLDVTTGQVSEVTGQPNPNAPPVTPRPAATVGGYPDTAATVATPGGYPGPATVLAAVEPTASPAPSSAVPIRAVYLVYGQAVLTPSDVQAHPEILVAHSFNELAAQMSRPVAIWVDKGAALGGGAGWVDTAPQAWYPIVLVGYNNPLYSFDRVMHMCCFSGPAVFDWGRLEPGFSVIQRQDAGGFPEATFIHGYDQVPTAGDILAITDALLDGRLKPTPSPVITAASPTPPPVVTPFMAEVELDGFSGRPNLTWPLSRAQIDTLRSKLAALSPAAAQPYPDRLGYRGLILTLADRADGQSPDSWRVWGGVAQMTNGAATAYYADPGQALERWLLQTGQPYLPADLLATAQAEMSSTPTP